MRLLVLVNIMKHHQRRYVRAVHVSSYRKGLHHAYVREVWSIHVNLLVCTVYVGGAGDAPSDACYTKVWC